MAAERRSREGYLVVADIAGYTSFLIGTELEHAQAIIEELTTLIRGRLSPPLRFVKLEGDAVFCYADAATFAEGERLIEVLEVCYFEFSSRLFDMARATTCPCAACASIGSLDLKFVAHFGTFVVQRTDGMEDLVGPDVILVHRLLKNSITERTGYRAYAFFTDACLQHMPPSFTLPRHGETYESLGEITGGVYDLRPPAEELREAQREYVGTADAAVEVWCDLPVPPPVAWQYFADPRQRVRWEPGGREPDQVTANQRGRVGVGAVTHCAHGGGGGRGYLHHCVDWRPFRYSTDTLAPAHASLLALPPWVATVELIARDDGGTRCVLRGRVQGESLLMRIRFRIGVPLLHAGWKGMLRRLKEIVEAEAAAGMDQG